LHDRGVITVADVAQLSERALVAMLGRAAGSHLHALAHNHDPRPVHVGRRRHSIGSQRAFGGRHGHSLAEADAAVVALVDRVTRRMRSANRVGRTVVLRLRFADFSRATRSHTMPGSTADTATILAVARTLLEATCDTIERDGLTLVGISVGNLDDDDAVQLAFSLDGHDHGALDGAVDDVRDRFGTSAITRAVLLGRDTGDTVPMLPD
jgi:DNA polymerase-4